MIQLNEELISKMPPEDQKRVREYAAQQQAEFEKQEVEAQRRKEEEFLRKYPPLKSILERISKKGGTRYFEDLKRAVLKRIHICLAYLRTPEDVAELREDQITVDLALTIMGRAQAVNMMVEDVGRILQDALGNSFIRIYPREMVQLREQCKKQAALAEKLVWSVTLQMVKKDGRYEPKAEVPAGEPVSG